MTLTYFPKVKDSNGDIYEVANFHTGVKSARIVVLPTVANAQISVTSASSRVMNALFAAIKLPSNSSRACAPSKGYFT